MSLEPKTSEERVHILIVEDSPTQAEQLRHLLEENHYRVTVATNGRQALALAGKINPVLVITDIVMPEMDGYELCRQIKSAENTQDISVILLTSLADSADVLEGIACGADNFITKPYNDDYLLACLENILLNRKLYQGERVRVGVEIMFGGKRRFVAANQQQILTLLLSTYEAAVRRNAELAQTQDELRMLNDRLEDLVEERTATLTAEITERKRAEEKLLASQKIIEDIINSISVRVFWKDMNLVFLGCNTAFARDAGFAEPKDIIGKDDYQMGWRDQAELYRNDDRQVIESGCPKLLIEEPQTAPDGKEITLLTNKTPLRNPKGEICGVLATYIDITERKQAEKEREKLETQLLQAQKMESVARLAGGVAHDFNNMLSVIIGRAEMALARLDSTDPNRDNLQEVISAGRRSAELTNQLLAFARKQVIAPQVLDLNDTVAGMLKMLQRLIGENIDLLWQPAANLWPVKMDPSQVDQMLANLVVNARDAIDGVGKVTIETARAEIDAAYCAAHADAMPGRYVMLAVSDNGCGMDRETLAQIFEPFFTTKEVGEGTGLGLATIFGIVKQNHGFVNVYSEPGKGTTFKLYLPRTEEELSESDKPTVSETPTGTETVLVVEDESALLELAEIQLAELGYTVLTAGRPLEAIDLAKAHQGEIHLLMTDVVMPEMSGRELLKQITPSRPQIKCLFMSGYTANVIAHQGVLDEGVQFLQKPFSHLSLATKVRETLDKK